MISPWISKDEETGLTERCLQLVSEGTRSVPPGNSMGTRVLSKLQDRSLTVRPCRLYDDVLWVLNSNNNPGCKLKLFPCLSQVDNVYTLIVKTTSIKIQWQFVCNIQKIPIQIKWDYL
jgi:hypothetical protein